MKVSDIFEMALINIHTEIDSKPQPDDKEPDEERFIDRDSSRAKAKRIAAKAKSKSKAANPGDGDTVSGWRSTPAASPVNNMSASAI